jgi:hypothetical protein
VQSFADEQLEARGWTRTPQVFDHKSNGLPAQRRAAIFGWRETSPRSRIGVNPPGNVHQRAGRSFCEKRDEPAGRTRIRRGRAGRVDQTARSKTRGAKSKCSENNP